MFIPFISCFAQKKLQTETIFIRHQTACKNVNGKYIRYRASVPLTKRLEPQVIILSQDKQNMSYELQGHISSAGLSINRVKNIRVEKEINKTQLTLKHIVDIKGIAGKEGAMIIGYNYKKEEELKIPEGIQVIKIELYEERSNQHPGSKLPKERLLSEKVIHLVQLPQYSFTSASHSSAKDN